MRTFVVAFLLLVAGRAWAGAPALTAGERAWLASAPTVTVGVQSDSAPYSYVDASGRATGYANEMFRLAAAHVGLHYRFEEGRPWETLWPRARDGHVDVLTFLWRTPDRERDLRYLEPPYLSHSLVFAIRADDRDPPTPANRRGKVFALGRDFAMNPVLRARFPDALFVEVDSVGDALRLVSQGKADAYVDDRGTINFIGAQEGLTNLRDGAAFDMPGTASYMAVRRDSPMLQAVLAKGLQAVDDRERGALEARWLRPSTSTSLARRIEPYVLRSLPVLPLVALALGWLVYSNRRLAREVRLRRAFEQEAAARAHALAERAAFQRQLLDAAQAAIMVLDGDGRWVVFNRFAEHLFGWEAGDLLGRVVRELSPEQGGSADASPHLVHPEQVRRSMAFLHSKGDTPGAADWTALYRLAELGLPPQRLDMRHRDGGRVPVLLSLARITDTEGRPAGLIAIANDIAEQLRLEDELRASQARAQEASEAKSAFVAAMSHEIRTPLIGVTGMVEVLAHGTLDAEQRRAINIIQASSESLLQIIGDILDFSKIEAGRLELAAVPVDVAALLRMAVAAFAGTASSKGLALACRVDPAAEGTYLADPLRLRQVLCNLVSNAVKFTAAGRVDVALGHAGQDAGGDRLAFRISDTGIGIGEAEQARLFEPFVQAEGETTRRFGGTGLGLAISRHLVGLMGGQMRLESRRGVGTTLRVELNLQRTALAPADPASPTRAAGAFVPRPLPTLSQAEQESSLVLVVDDHPTNRTVIARQLALAGYASESVADGREAMVQWRSGRFALVLSDVHMPDMDGYELARAIRAAEADAAPGTRRTPIVALTAAALKGEAERCLAAGMDDYLAKPVGIATLGATLRRWLPHTAPDAAPAGTLAQLDAPSPFDAAALDPLIGDDAAGARALLDDFLDSCDRDLHVLQAAHAAGDVGALLRQAHRIKGAARLVGAVELSAAAETVESGARDSEHPSLAPHITDVATAIERIRLYVEARWPR